MNTIRVLLVDDHALVRAGIAALLATAEDLSVVAEASSGEEAVELAAQLRPDVVLMDLTMPGIGGLEATRRIVALDHGAQVMILTMQSADEFLLPVLHAGGSGYVTKDCADGLLFEAIRTVAQGQVFLPPSCARLLLESFRGPLPPVEEDPLQLLSEREREVLQRTASGYTAAEIGAALQISPKTVDTYRQRMMEKLHLSRRSDLVQFALRRGLLTPAA